MEKERRTARIGCATKTSAVASALRVNAFQDGHAAAEGVVGDAPAVFVEDRGAMLVDVNLKIFLDGSDYAAGVGLSCYAAAVSHAIDVAQIGVVERDPAAR